MKSTLRTILLLPLAQLVLSGCAAHEMIAERTWREVKTPNFVLVSDMSEERALEIARDLERFRAVVEFVTGRKMPTAPVPTDVYAFQKLWEYQRFSVPGLGGYFIPGMRGNSIVFAERSGGNIPAQQVIQHEYVHFLVNTHGKVAYPQCYNEGFAEFLGTAWIHGNRIDIGRSPGRSLAGWTPIETLLEHDNSRRLRSSEYFQCWGLVHYLSFGRPNASENLKQLTAFLQARSSGLSVSEAIPKAYGMSLEELDKAVRKYLEDGEFPYVTTEVSRFDTETDHATRLISPDEISVLLGDLLIRAEEADEAERYYRNAVQINPGNSRAWAGIGNSLLLNEEVEQSDSHFQRALALDASDPRNHIDYGSRFAAAAEKSESGSERADLAREARIHYTRAWELDDTRPEAYARYGETFLLEGQDPEIGREPLEHANRLLPGDHDIQLMLAQLYVKLGEQDKARGVLLRAAAESHGAFLPDWAKELLDDSADD